MNNFIHPAMEMKFPWCINCFMCRSLCSGHVVCVLRAALRVLLQPEPRRGRPGLPDVLEVCQCTQVDGWIPTHCWTPACTRVYDHISSC